MFGKKKKVAKGKHLIAIRDYNNTVKAINDKNISLPYDFEKYHQLLATQGSKLDNLKGLNKFIKKHNMIKNEVKHHFEGLIIDGYTIVEVKYDQKDPDITQLCETKGLLKYVCEG